MRQQDWFGSFSKKRKPFVADQVLIFSREEAAFGVDDKRLLNFTKNFLEVDGANPHHHAACFNRLSDCGCAAAAPAAAMDLILLCCYAGSIKWTNR